MPTTNYHIGPTDSLTQALKAAQPNSIIHLAPGLYDLGAYQSIREPSPLVSIQAENPDDPPVIQCPATLQITGAQDLDFYNLTIDGRINLDNNRETRANGGVTFDRILWRFTSTKVSTKDMLKVAHVIGVRVVDSAFIRTIGVTDRPVDCVNADNIYIADCYFENPLQGAIQIKGGSISPYVGRCIVNCTKPGAGLGQRAIQLGGSSCYACFGWNEDGSPRTPAQVEYECINGLVENNRVYNAVAPFVSSTSIGNVFRNNLAYCDPRFGYTWLARVLQEDEDRDNPQLKGQREITWDRNIWLYHVVNGDGKAGVNAEVINKGGVGSPQDYESIRWDRNAFYAVSPIVGSSFGARGIYPHRHPAVMKGQWNPMDITGDGNWLNQYPPMIRGNWKNCTAINESYVGVGPHAAGGPNWMPMAAWGGVPQLPKQLAEYDSDIPLYGWDGRSMEVFAVEEPPKEPGTGPGPMPDPTPSPTPVIEYQAVDWEGAILGIFPDIQTARDYRRAITIERVETIRTQVEAEESADG